MVTTDYIPSIPAFSHSAGDMPLQSLGHNRNFNDSTQKNDLPSARTTILTASLEHSAIITGTAECYQNLHLVGAAIFDMVYQAKVGSHDFIFSGKAKSYCWCMSEAMCITTPYTLKLLDA